MDYYKNNAIYDHLIQSNLPHYKFVVGNAWQLVYGNKSCQPLVLIFAVGVPNSHLSEPPSDQEKEAFSLLEYTGKKAGLRVGYIRFACDIPEIDTVITSNGSFNYTTVNMDGLSRIFESTGLPVSRTATAKYLNDKSSSAYHNWQRSSLGVDLTVSDIDLWRLDNEGNPEIIYELKRSYYDLEKWKPFTDDYRNFQLLSNLCQRAGIKLKILYNQRIKTPFQDKIDRLKIFSVDFSKNPPIENNGIITLKEFENL
jgi:hypothetical protein